ncbi:MAG TPA: phytoene desaturase family protein [Tepidisphaeraceae bacterium]|jgi:phytoene desaturase
MSSQSKRLTSIVIGGGVGGLAAAARMAANGTQCTLIEKLPAVGGKLHFYAASEQGPDPAYSFRFDTGPSLLTLPLVFADLFAACGEDIRDHLSIRRLDPVARFQWADGQTFTLRAGRDALMDEVRRFAPGDVDGFARFLAFGKKVWDLSGELFLSKSPEQALRGDGAFSPLNALRTLAVPLRIGMFRKYAGEVDARVKSGRLREVLYQYATYSGASPFKAPATLAVIPHVELAMGGWYVDGGMYKLAEAIEGLARRKGVDVRTGTAAERILIDAPAGGGKPRGPLGVVRGVRLAGGEEIAADVVICNADVVYAYRQLIEPRFRRAYADDKLARLEPGGSGMVLVLGVKGTYPQLAHHTKFMPADYTSDLRAMFETRTIPDDPCIYVCASTRTDPSQAPPGCENLFVLCSAPPLDGAIDWATAGPRYRDKIVRTLEERFGLTDLSTRIVAEGRYTPADLQSRYNANAGSIYGISGNGVKQAFLRPPNRDRDVRGLFFAGGATHPGGGLPLVALSGKIASELAGEYLAGR